MNKWAESIRGSWLASGQIPEVRAGFGGGVLLGAIVSFPPESEYAAARCYGRP